jgi:hypothetical protein
MLNGSLALKCKGTREQCDKISPHLCPPIPARAASHLASFRHFDDIGFWGATDLRHEPRRMGVTWDLFDGPLTSFVRAAP